MILTKIQVESAAFNFFDGHLGSDVANVENSATFTDVLAVGAEESFVAINGIFCYSHLLLLILLVFLFPMMLLLSKTGLLLVLLLLEVLFLLLIMVLLNPSGA